MALFDIIFSAELISAPPYLLIAIFLVGWSIRTAIYRLYFSPIAKFPGPKLAALTLWYEFFYDVLRGGQYAFKIQELHKKYGPIVRISPYELHVYTPQFYEELYSGASKKRNKYDWYCKWAATPDGSLGTVGHDLQRVRRGALNPYFSKASVRRLQPLIQERVDILLARIKEFGISRQPLTISLAYVAFSSDVVAQYSFGRSYHRLERPDFDPIYAQSMHEATRAFHFNKQFIWPFRLLIFLPSWLATKLAPALYTYVAFIHDCEAQIKSIMKSSKEQVNEEGLAHPTIFHELLQSHIPAKEKSVSRLVQEAQIVVSAGTETTSWCLSVVTFHLLDKPSILQNLREELVQAIPDPEDMVPVEKLHQVPYLTTCIQEGLRLCYGVSTRLARISPDEVMVFRDGKKEWEIPPGTPTSMTSYLVHHNPTIFPDSHTYNPQRFLDNPRLDKYLVSFTKGTRQCIGINLAYAELYTSLASIFRRYGGPEGEAGPEGRLLLFETSKEDVEMVADMFIPFVKKGSKGIRVLVKN
ncbi:putative cytochrome P450 [Stipitochalara longipes BDJ]|nr:putative cytochrome P450 [Stipitochalara longipes BDJ]